MASFFNQATLSYSGGTVTSNATSGELLDVLAVTKTAVIDEYNPNSQITYIINVINSGSTAQGGLTLNDDLGAYSLGGTTVQPLTYVEGSVKYFINGILQEAPTVETDEGLVITPINVPASGDATIVYVATANEFANPETDGSITNTVTIDGTCAGAITTSETVTAANVPLLEIVKSLCPSVVSRCDGITYTFTIQNNGNTDATEEDDIVITDTFTPPFESITVTYNGETWSSPEDYTYDSETGLFQTTAGAITVPAATFTQNPETGEWATTPGTATLTVTGNI